LNINIALTSACGDMEKILENTPAWQRGNMIDIALPKMNEEHLPFILHANNTYR
jgi:hypothetical protein